MFIKTKKEPIYTDSHIDIFKYIETGMTMCQVVCEVKKKPNLTDRWVLLHGIMTSICNAVFGKGSYVIFTDDRKGRWVGERVLFVQL